MGRLWGRFCNAASVVKDARGCMALCRGNVESFLVTDGFEARMSLDGAYCACDG